MPSDVRLDAEILAGQMLLRLGRGLMKRSRDSSRCHRRGTRLAIAIDGARVEQPGHAIREPASVRQALAVVRTACWHSTSSRTAVHVRDVDEERGTVLRAARRFRPSCRNAAACHCLHERRGAAGPYQQALGELGSTYLLMDEIPKGLLVPDESAGRRGASRVEWRRCAVGAQSRRRPCLQEHWDEAERFNEQARRLSPANIGRMMFSTLHAADIADGRGQNEDAIRLFRRS